MSSAKIVITRNGGRMDFELGAGLLHPSHHRRRDELARRPRADYRTPLFGLPGQAAGKGARTVRSDRGPPFRYRFIAAAPARRGGAGPATHAQEDPPGCAGLCLAGGVAFNCVANGKILEHTGFDEVYVQSAAGDAGLAIGSAWMYVWHHELGHPREFVMEHSYWGPQFGAQHIGALSRFKPRPSGTRGGCAIQRIDDEAEVDRKTARAIAEGKVIGWFQGRMEWGPRALGNRSILADPLLVNMRDILNAKIKRREMFRPVRPLDPGGGDRGLFHSKLSFAVHAHGLSGQAGKALE